ncbi:ThuA domain-containing protein [Bradyrhizobium sp. 17]|uniref:ThuA domain-containing protein n=1 Tax=Bradyrhizobium sp. 17 TaxID=2782649 RepID=UPI001FF77CBF
MDLGKTGVHQRFYGWPLTWTRFYGEGRVFYSALGHEPSVWQDARYQRILTNAILWSMRRSPQGDAAALRICATAGFVGWCRARGSDRLGPRLPLGFSRVVCP